MARAVHLRATLAAACRRRDLRILASSYTTTPTTPSTSSAAAYTTAESVRKQASDIEVVYDPLASDNPASTSAGHDGIVDIVAVHGLASKSQLAWTHRTTGRQWLREFLPAGLRHRARILAFSHDSRWQTHALLKSFESYGADLLLAVERARHPSSHPPNHDPDQPHSHHQSVSTATARRPLIFLCHSFGGLIVKKALVMANVRRGEEARFAAIADATVGVVFLGVPHEGSKLSKLARAQSAVLKAFGSSSHLLELVGEDSETARRLHHDYLSGYAGLRHVCFYESEETYVGSVPIGPVVSQKSATIPGCPAIDLATNHRGLNKFASEADDNYLKVLQQLNLLVDESANILTTIQGSQKQLHWVVPYSQNKLFTRRNDILQQIDKHLSENPGHARIALFGLGGGGKTQIALDYAYRSKGLRDVFWVHASSRDRFAEDYHRIAEEVGIPGVSENLADDKALARVRDWFQSAAGGDYLLVVDNADNLADVTDILPFIPQGHRGVVLLTTRSHQVALRLKCEPFRLGAMEPEEATALLTHHYAAADMTEQDRAALPALAQELEFLPLALVAATSFMHEAYTPPDDYLALLRTTRQNQQELLLSEFSDVHRQQAVSESVLSTYFITFRQVESQLSLTGDLLRLLACLDRHRIPEELLRVSGVNRGVDNPVSFRRAIGLLRGYSLLTETAEKNTYEVHRLVHLAIRAYLARVLAPEDRATYAIMALDAVDRCFPHETRKYRNWPTYALYLAQALAVTSPEFLQAVPADKLNQEKVANVLYRIAWYQSQMGWYDDAEAYTRRCFDLREAAAITEYAYELPVSIPSNNPPIGEEAVAVARAAIAATPSLPMLEAMELRAVVAHRKRNYTEALRLYERVLGGKNAALGKTHPETLDTLNNLGLLFAFTRRNAHALTILTSAYNSRKRVLGPDHEETLCAIHNIGLVYWGMRDHDMALKWYRRALEGRLRVLGVEHPEYLSTVNNIGLIHQAKSRYEEALECYKIALSGREKALGEDHPSTLNTVHNVGWVFYKQKKYDEATAWFRRALEGRERTLGHDHHSTRMSRNKLAHCEFVTGKRSAPKWHGPPKLKLPNPEPELSPPPVASTASSILLGSTALTGLTASKPSLESTAASTASLELTASLESSSSKPQAPSLPPSSSST